MPTPAPHTAPATTPVRRPEASVRGEPASRPSPAAPRGAGRPGRPATWRLPTESPRPRAGGGRARRHHSWRPSCRRPSRARWHRRRGVRGTYPDPHGRRPVRVPSSCGAALRPRARRLRRGQPTEHDARRGVALGVATPPATARTAAHGHAEPPTDTTPVGRCARARTFVDGGGRRRPARAAPTSRRRRRAAPTTTAASSPTRPRRSPSFVTGVQFLPGNPALVHHSILFRVEPARSRRRWRRTRPTRARAGSASAVRGSRRRRATRPRRAGRRARGSRDGRPEAGRTCSRDGLGVPLPVGSRIVMQMHYNLRAATARGPRPRTTRTCACGCRPARDLTPMRTMLLPAPVELPVPATGHRAAVRPRATAVADVDAAVRRRRPCAPSAGSSCCAGETRSPLWREPPRPACAPCVEPVTVRAAAGHMHLLGKSISDRRQRRHQRGRARCSTSRCGTSTTSGPGRSPSRSRSRRATPITVTCTHDPTLRDQLPALQGVPRPLRRLGRGHHRRDVPRESSSSPTDPSPSARQRPGLRAHARWP